MAAKVVLTVKAGPLTGTVYAFPERTATIIGRAPGCEPLLPNDADHQAISRNHCMLDINPPDVTIRDFGSLNGTYVNGDKIGQRQEGGVPGQGAERTLHAGDEIRLGGTVFEVDILGPLLCAGCGAAAEGKLLSLKEDPKKNRFLCEGCKKKLVKEQLDEALRQHIARKCTKCGKDVREEIGDARPGEYVCRACRERPVELLEHLLRSARRGDNSTTAIEGYEIERELGRGGMGAVYLARRNDTGEHCALKVMLPQVALDPRQRDTFLRECRNMQLMKHPNVVAMYEFGCSSGTFFLTIEFCNRGALDSLLEERGKLPLAEAAPLILQALEGLDYAHRVEIETQLEDGSIRKVQGLVHRDIKPGNIFLSDASGALVAKLGDYGLAKAFDAAGLSGRTRTGAKAGTPVYMPRQQVINYRYAKPEVDVWAMAASFYTILCGPNVFPRDFSSRRDPWQTVLQAHVVPIRKRQPKIPKPVAEIIDRALDDRGDLYYRRARDLRIALEEVL